MLLKPRLEMHTLVLWLATPALFVAALLIIALAYYRRKREAQKPEPLTVAERRKLKRLLGER